MGDTKYNAPAAACAAEILLCLAVSPEAMPMSAIASQIGRTKSLVFRVLKELESRDCVRDVGNGRYWLGISCLELGGSFISQSDYTSTARDVLQQLSPDTRETVALATLRGNEVLYLEKWQGEYSVVTFTHVGRRLPAGCTALGKALLAEMDHEEIDRLYEEEPLPTLTMNSISSKAELIEDLEATRLRGYSVEHNESLTGRACIAGVIPQGSDEGESSESGAVSISMSLHRYEAEVAVLADQLFRARDQLASNWTTPRLFAPR